MQLVNNLFVLSTLLFATFLAGATKPKLRATNPDSYQRGAFEEMEMVDSNKETEFENLERELQHHNNDHRSLLLLNVCYPTYCNCNTVLNPCKSQCRETQAACADEVPCSQEVCPAAVGGVGGSCYTAANNLQKCVSSHSLPRQYTNDGA